MKNRCVINLGAGPNQLPVICAARQLGCQVVAVDRDPSAPGMAVADAAMTASTHDPREVIEKLRSYRRTYQGLLARTCGPPIITAARVCEAFGITGITDQLAQMATRKSALRAFATANGIPVVAGWPEDTPAGEMVFPLIVKPDQTVAGKKGITVVHTPGALERALTAARSSSGNGCAVVERFIQGSDITCLMLLDKGCSFPLFVFDEIVGVNLSGDIKGLAVSMPSIAAGTKCERMMLRIMEQFAALFQGARAILAFSFRIDCQRLRPFVIELHADLTGDLILDALLPNAYSGQSILRKIVDVALGAPPFTLAPADATPTAVRYCDSSHEVVKANSILEVLQKIKNRAGEFTFHHIDMSEKL